MTFGDVNTFAIESGITEAYARPSLLGLGFFVVHIAGIQYGVKNPAATMLANSFGEVEARLRLRGQHTGTFAQGRGPLAIANAFRRAVYLETHESETFFGMDARSFEKLLNNRHIVWAPDGDEAFDDGSYILHFDTGAEARLIGFRTLDNGDTDVATLTDQHIPADLFYSILEDWKNAFEREWQSMLKTVEAQT